MNNVPELKSYKKKFMKKILFSGCSFTWGESIELENSKYLELLKSGDVTVKHDLGFYTGYQHGHFHDIASEVNSIQHRIKYRYPTLVTNHFDCIGYVKEYNGGANAANFHMIQNFGKQKSKVDLVVVQLSHAVRDLEHFYYHKIFKDSFGLNHENIEAWNHTVLPMWMTFEKDKEFIHHLPKSVYKDCADKTNGKFTAENIMKIMETWEYDFDAWWKYHYEIVYEQYLQSIEAIEKNIAPVLLIGSWSDWDVTWEKEISDTLRIKLNKYKVRIKGYKDLYHYIKNTEGADYTCSSFNLPEYLQNHHPSIKTHQAIADDLISEIEKRNLL